MYNNLGRTSDAAKRAISISCKHILPPTAWIQPSHSFLVVQLGFTTLFGWFTSALFLRSQSAYAIVFSHSFCNFMGLPTIGDDLQRFPTQTGRKYLLPFMMITALIIDFYDSHLVGACGRRDWLCICIVSLVPSMTSHVSSSRYMGIIRDYMCVALLLCQQSVRWRSLRLHIDAIRLWSAFI